MTYLFKRPDSDKWWYRQKVPIRCREAVKGKFVPITFPAFRGEPAWVADTTLGIDAKFSTRTADRVVAEAREGIARTHLAKIFDAAVSDAVALTHKQAVALAGEVYHLYLDTLSDDPGSPYRWAAWKGICRAAQEGRLLTAPALSPGSLAPDEEGIARDLFASDLTAGINALPMGDPATALEERFGRLAHWTLANHALNVDGDSRKRLLVQIAQAALDAGWQLKRNAQGDYRRDSKSERFPAFVQAPAGITLTDLFDRWKSEVRPSGSTVTTWRGVVVSLREHAGDKAISITPDKVIAWKDALVARNLSAKTINDSYLTAIRTLFNWGLTNRLVPSNPAIGIKVRRQRRAGEGRLPYTDAEVGRLLALARAETDPSRRWLPWLAALSGSRVGEVAQMLGKHVNEIDGVQTIFLTRVEESAPFKNETSERTVPIHPAIIAEGFLDFVRSKGEGPLFYGGRPRRGRTRTAGDGSRHASKGVTNRLGTWIRSNGFTDKRKAPSHALRHWFKTKAQAVMPDSVADAIQGHAGRTEADGYRHSGLATMAEALARFPVPPLPKLDREREGDRSGAAHAPG